MGANLIKIYKQKHSGTFYQYYKYEYYQYHDCAVGYETA